jgi:hypothetical protein
MTRLNDLERAVNLAKMAETGITLTVEGADALLRIAQEARRVCLEKCFNCMVIAHDEQCEGCELQEMAHILAGCASILDWMTYGLSYRFCSR